MPTIKLTLKIPPFWLFTLIFSIFLLLSIWLTWPNWLFLILLLLNLINFIVLTIKAKNKIKVVIGFSAVVFISAGLLFTKNFKIQRKTSTEKSPNSQQTQPPSITEKSSKQTPTPTYKYKAPLKIAKQCVLGASPCNKQLFDWERLVQIVVLEESMFWDPVKDNEFWMIQQPSPEVEARLVNKEVWRVYFEVPPKPPEGRIQNPDESTRITIDKETNKITDVQQGWGPAFITPGHGETIPSSHWP